MVQPEKRLSLVDVAIGLIAALLISSLVLVLLSPWLGLSEEYRQAGYLGTYLAAGIFAICLAWGFLSVCILFITRLLSKRNRQGAGFNS